MVRDALLLGRFSIVMAGLVPAIHDLSRRTKNVDARDKPGHDEQGHVTPSKTC
jgi:hypothetical protein